jgi:WD40 repeat protein
MGVPGSGTVGVVGVWTNWPASGSPSTAALSLPANWWPRETLHHHSVFQFLCGEGCPQSCVFVSESVVVCGSDDGLLTVLDTRQTGRAVQLFLSSSAVTSLSPLSPQTCIAGYADGTAIIWRLDSLFEPVSKLTGPDIDHVTSVCLRGDKIYTSCRDGCVRVYSANHLPLSS